MGNTTRREPVNSKIPSSPNYKFLNITNFSGIHQTDNPLNTLNNMATDCLNVYVDETNTLTTRPRLEKIITHNTEDAIYSYKITNGFLQHCIINGVGELMLVNLVDNTITQITTIPEKTIPTQKLVVFEKEDYIYCLSSSGYYQIKDNIITEVEPTIPITKRAKTLKTDGTVYQSRNLLTNKYKESYFWDGTWNIDTELNGPEIVNIENNYLPQTPQEIEETNTWLIKPIPNYYKKQENYTYWLCYRLGSIFILGHHINDTSLNTSESVSYPPDCKITGDIAVDCSDDGAVIVFGFYGSDSSTSTDNGAIYISRADTTQNKIKFYKLSRDTDVFKKYTATQNYITMSSDGFLVSAYSSNKMLCWRYVVESDSYEIKEYALPSGFDKVTGVYGSRLGDFVLYLLRDTSDLTKYINGIYTISNLFGDSETTTHAAFSSIIDNTYSKFECAAVSNTGQCAISIGGVFVYFPNLSSLTKYTKYNNRHTQMFFSDDNDKLYFLTGPGLGWYELNNFNKIEVSLSSNYSEQASKVSGTYFSKSIGNSNQVYLCYTSIYVENNMQNNARIAQFINFNFTRITPDLVITRIDTTDNTDITDFLNTNGCLLYDERLWLYGKNKIYYSDKYDILMFPVNNYDILGNAEDITGLNILDEKTMAAYKPHSVHIITPYVDSTNGIDDYYFLDSKITVGNIPNNAPITTIYNEKPLQITYDGVYVLTQVANITTTDRISESLTDSIIKKWLSEGNNIHNIITTNRLYWTYIIIPQDDKQTSHIFLLDNRYNSWYYWEVPIYITQTNIIYSSNYNEEILYVADKTGTIYGFFKSDITTGNTTEYYDLDFQPIPWFWRSQILSLGTMNYSKKLITTTFITTDTDETDEYCLDYKFKVFRKLASETSPVTLKGTLNYVQSTTKKTIVPRFNFIQFEISNEENLNDTNTQHNKLRLVGIGLKYELLAGLM